MEQRVASVMEKLNLTRQKAKRYVEAVEDDRKTWVKKFYNVDWDVATLYDLVVNLGKVSATNAATAACAMAQLPEFQPSPASVNALKDLQMAAHARLMLARNETTAGMSLKVTADRSVVRVTYSFMQAAKVKAVKDVLQGMPNASQIICTEAQTNVLWIQEAFDANDRSCDDILSVANAWDAAVDIVQLMPADNDVRLPVKEEIARRGLETWRQTGIIDDRDDAGPQEPKGLSQTYERLINCGRAGGKQVLRGSTKSLLRVIDRSVPYRMVVFDNVFLSRSPEVRKRSIQEWSNTLSDALKIPVVTLQEIRSQYRFGLKQAIQMLVAAIVTTLVVVAIFRYQDTIIAFFLREGTFARILTTLCVVVFVPLFAYIYSSLTSRFLRMIRLE
jgi:hypothetical protein